jgi:hypothetical protein
MEIVDRLWSKVDMNGGPERLRWETIKDAEGDGSPCWIWLGTKNNLGYGSVCIGRENGVQRLVGAHRFAWKLANGPIPEDMHVCHYCDHRACVNPAHLYLGTHGDHAAYMSKKGHCMAQLYPEKVSRGDTHYLHLHPEKRNGVLNSASRLTEEDVKEIRRLRQTGKPLQELAHRFNVTFTNIDLICRRKTWKHLEGKVDFTRTYAAGEDFEIEHGIPNVRRNPPKQGDKR